MDPKLARQGSLLAVQPRIRLTRSFDGSCAPAGPWAGVEREFVVALGKAAQAKHGFRAGDRVEGKALPVARDGATGPR